MFYNVQWGLWFFPIFGLLLQLELTPQALLALRPLDTDWTYSSDFPADSGSLQPPTTSTDTDRGYSIRLGARAKETRSSTADSPWARNTISSTFVGGSLLL